MDDVFDHAFARFILGVGLAAEDQLEFAATDACQPLQVTQDQIPTLVGGRAAGEADGQQFGIKTAAGRFLDVLEEKSLGAAMGVPDLFVRDVVDPHQQFRFVRPTGDVFVKKADEKGGGPGEGVNAVGDGVDLETGKEVLRDLPVFFRHAVDVAAQVEGEHGHVEFIRPGQLLQQPHRYRLTQHPSRQIVGETIVPSRHRCMGGEDTLLDDPVRIPGGTLVPGAFQGMTGAVEQFQGQESGMPLVHVILLDGEAEGVEDAGAADAEDDLLFEPVGEVAAVEIIGDVAVGFDVAGDIGVEKEYRNDAAGGTFHPVEPGLHLDVAVFDGHQCFRRQKFHDRAGIPGHRCFMLTAGFVQALAEIAVAADQGHRHQRQFQIGGAFDGVAGEDAEAAAVGRDVGGQPDFHGEIGNARFLGETFPRVHESS